VSGFRSGSVLSIQATDQRKSHAFHIKMAVHKYKNIIRLDGRLLYHLIQLKFQGTFATLPLKFQDSDLIAQPIFINLL
jgi:hypothetical protein